MYPILGFTRESCIGQMKWICVCIGSVDNQISAVVDKLISGKLLVALSVLSLCFFYAYKLIKVSECKSKQV